ncbi:hypothetical protein ACXX82_24295 [Glaciimonas sp. GNP009]
MFSAISETGNKAGYGTGLKAVFTIEFNGCSWCDVGRNHGGVEHLIGVTVTPTTPNKVSASSSASELVAASAV